MLKTTAVGMFQDTVHIRDLDMSNVFGALLVGQTYFMFNKNSSYGSTSLNHAKF